MLGWRGGLVGREVVSEQRGLEFESHYELHDLMLPGTVLIEELTLCGINTD